MNAKSSTEEIWADSENEAPNTTLRAELDSTDHLQGSLTGYSTVTGHAEPGFAASLSVEAACDLGLKFKQDAIYYIDTGLLNVSYRYQRRRLEPVGTFLERLDPLP